jgi:hypothetical protein
MEYCLNVEGLTSGLLASLDTELRSMFASRSIQGSLHVFPTEPDHQTVASSVALHPEPDEATIFLQGHAAPATFFATVLGLVITFLADRGCEVIVAEV